MGWKDLPYWLKGGIIGSIFSIILFILLIGLIASMPPMLWGASGIEFLTRNPVAWVLLLIILAILLFVFFAAGAVIGLVVIKIKSKNKN